MTDARFPEDPEALLNEIWRRLEAGVASASHAFHTAALATADGGGPDARTVVLRRAEPGLRRICCHTDLRSRKVEQLGRQSAAAWIFYDPEERVQLRARGPVTLHADDDLAQAQWEASQPGSRRCYLSAGGPGSALDAPGSGLPESLLDRRPSEAESAPGRVHFAVLACELTELDWLALDSRGHRRARFRWDDGAWQHAWITP
ncbi:MAG: pyridoxamine 5'-phosphate oxidase family protein [Gammaproteobacteria bacterium]